VLAPARMGRGCDAAGDGGGHEPKKSRNRARSLGGELPSAILRQSSRWLVFFSPVA
jgi:hypothetical protein